VQFRLDTQKAIEAAATLLRLHRNRCMDWKRLLALLYIVDRESLKRTGRPIIGGRLVAMKHGPVHSEVYNFIKGGHAHQSRWSPHFGNDDGHRILLRDDPDIRALSRFDINLLNEVSQAYASFGTWDVANKTHDFPEYKPHEENVRANNTSVVIRFEDLIDAVDRGADKEAILQDAAEKDHFDRLFAGKT
jgi:uncharacterized phage-associated protein